MRSMVSVFLVNGEDSDKQARKFNDILNCFLDQFVITTVYTLACVILSIIPPDELSNNAKISFVFYIGMLIVLAIVSAVRANNGTRSSYSKESNTAIFLLHLFACAVFFIIMGRSKEDDNTLTMGWTCLLLYIGFSISLSDILVVRNARDFFKATIKPFIEAELLPVDYTMVLFLDLFIFLLLYIVDDAKGKIAIAVLLASVLVFVIILDSIRKKRRDKLINLIRLLPEKEHILIYRLGTENVLYPSIENEFGGSSCNEIHSLTDINNITYIIILNALIDKHTYIHHLNKLLTAVDKDVKILDPSIQPGKCKPSILFRWSSTPCKEVQSITVAAYKRMLEQCIN